MPLLVSAGKSRCQIIVPEGAAGPCRFAGEELGRYLGLISGAEAPLRARPEGGLIPVWVGTREELERAGAPGLFPAPAEGHDGHALHVGESELLVIGENPRGALYGVYALLERVGCRWFHPQHDPRDEEVVPRSSEIELRAVDCAVASPFVVRAVHAWSSNYVLEPEMAKRDIDWAAKVRFNTYTFLHGDKRKTLEEMTRAYVTTGVAAELGKRGMLLYGPEHGFGQLLPNEPSFAEHPEWFGEFEGERRPHGRFQFCWSNEEAGEFFVGRAVEYVRRNPHVNILGLYPIDGGRPCECARCRESTPSDLYLGLMNKLAGELEREAPEVMVEGLCGYPPVEAAPRRERAHPRLRLIFAHFGRDHRYPYDDGRYGRRGLLEAWRAVCDHLSVCQYYGGLLSEPRTAPPYAQAIAGDYRYLTERGVDGVYVINYPRGSWWISALNNYLAGEAAYDVSLDPFRLVEDYGRRYFGEAGEAMASYYGALARDLDLAYHIRDDLRPEAAGPSSLAADRERVELLRGLMEQALAMAGRPLTRFRVDKAARVEAYRRRQQASRERRAEVREALAGLEEGQGAPEEVARLIRSALKAEEEDQAFALAELCRPEDGLLEELLVVGWWHSRFINWLGQELEGVEKGRRPGKKGEREGLTEARPEDAPLAQEEGDRDG